MPSPLEQAFPNLRQSNYGITSPFDQRYNCIAWAAGDTSRMWWPSPFSHWPPGVPRDVTIEAFAAAFAQLGFKPCEDGNVERDIEKVALFATPDGTPTHMARQLESGAWTSKLGKSEDIAHDRLDAVAGQIYGSVVRFFKRSR